MLGLFLVDSSAHLYATVSADLNFAVAGIMLTLAQVVYFYDFVGSVVMVATISGTTVSVLAFPDTSVFVGETVQDGGTVAVRAGWACFGVWFVGCGLVIH